MSVLGLFLGDTEAIIDDESLFFGDDGFFHGLRGAQVKEREASMPCDEALVAPRDTSLSLCEAGSR